jgi:hypothetical protein
MSNTPDLNLAPAFAKQLAEEGLSYIGYYEIGDHNVCKIYIDREAGNWEFSVYTHVSYAHGGKHVRIGKCEGPLRVRLNSWPRYLGDALNITMPRNRQYKGGTPPWEAQGWVEYTVPYRRGILFARRVGRLATIEETKRVLRHLERELQDQYDPPLCNDTRAGRKLRDAWVNRYGRPLVIKKSEAPMTTVKTHIRIASDGTFSGRVSGLPPGEHEVEIALVDTGEGEDRPDANTLLARVRATQQEIAELPIPDKRSPDQIIGYN